VSVVFEKPPCGRANAEHRRAKAMPRVAARKDVGILTTGSRNLSGLTVKILDEALHPKSNFRRSKYFRPSGNLHITESHLNLLKLT
jgi:hypothetical protein